MRLIWNGSDWVEPWKIKRTTERSALPCPMIIADFSEPVFSHKTGKYYGSRSQWRQHLKDHGMVELGNEMPKGPQTKPALTPEAISEAYDQCVAGKGVKLPDSPPEGWEGPIE